MIHSDAFLYWNHYLSIALLCLGLAGLLIRRDPLTYLLSIVLILLCPFFLFLETFSSTTSEPWEYVIGLLILIGLQFLIGLGIVRVLRSRNVEDIQSLRELRG